MHVKDVMDGYGVGRHGPAWIHEKRAGIAIEPPNVVVALTQVLPPDLAYVIRPVSACFKIDDTDAQLIQLYARE